MPSIRFQSIFSYFHKWPGSPGFVMVVLVKGNKLVFFSCLSCNASMLFAPFLWRTQISNYMSLLTPSQYWDCTENRSAVSVFPVFICGSARVLLLHTMQDNRPALQILFESNKKVSFCLARNILDHIPMISHRSPAKLSHPWSRGSVLLMLYLIHLLAVLQKTTDW